MNKYFASLLIGTSFVLVASITFAQGTGQPGSSGSGTAPASPSPSPSPTSSSGNSSGGQPNVN